MSPSAGSGDPGAIPASQRERKDPNLLTACFTHNRLAASFQTLISLVSPHSEAHTTGGPPSWEKRRHPLLLMGAGMLVTVVLLWVCLSVAAWVTGIIDELQYGYPRTTQLDRNVGHSQGQAASHFVAINTHGQVYVLEIPGGKPEAAQLLVGV